VDICPLDAMTLNEDDIAVVNLKRCIGCFTCVSNCPEDAISLKKKEDEFVPPKTPEELHEIIMTNKKTSES